MLGLAALSRRPWSSFLELFGVPKEALEQIGGLATQWERFAAVDQTAAALAEIGWPYFEMTPMDEAAEAAELIRAGKLDEADELLVASWNDRGALALRFSVQEIGKLYELPGLVRQPPQRPDIGHQRAILIREAWDCHVAGQYAAAINLTLAQIDGVCRDFEQQLFFSRKRNTTEPRANLTDDITLAGHPEALMAVAQMMTESCNTTEISGRFLRHGIMHGRELGYGTLRNSTLALATLRMLIVRVRPVADRLLAEAAQVWREQIRGSTERDQYGHRLDTEGFVEAKRCLDFISIWQHRHYEDHGRYGNSLDEIAGGRPLYDKFGHGQTRCTEDGQRYWAWASATTEAPYYFGLSCRDGEKFDWRYAGDTPPARPVATADEHEPGVGGWYGVRDGPGSPDY